MRRYSVWCEDWSDWTKWSDPMVTVRVRGCWTRKGMVRKVRKLNANRAHGATYRFFGKEG